MISRGCVAGLSDVQLDECKDGEICKICHGEMCNTKPTFQKCYSCDSQNESSCATLQGILPEKICDEYLDTCKVYVIPNMTTHRGCVKEMLADSIECSPQSVNCKQCSDNNCNGDIFPSNRLSCFHCEGANSDSECYKKLDDSNELSHPCRTYNFRDSCYFHITDEKVVHRGCMSDATAEMCLKDPLKCRSCQTSGCNSESVMKAPQLSCISCDTTGGVECNWGWLMSRIAKCKHEIFFYEEESCHVLTVSNQTIRGCTLDGNVCRVSSRCELCKDDGCNRANTAQDFCYDCSSIDDPKCLREPFHTKNVTCPGIIEYEHRGCFTWIDDDDSVKRGCYSELTADQRTRCSQPGQNCKRCVDEANCNNQTKDSSRALASSVILMGFLMILNLFCA